MKKARISKFQEQFWLLNSLAKSSSAYNIPSLFRLDKKPDITILQETLNILVQRHEPLRTSFAIEENTVYQYIAPAASVNTTIREVNIHRNTNNSPELDSEILMEIHKTFDLSVAPLFRVTFFNFIDSYYLTIVFHHIIVDLHSKEIFAKDFSFLYNSILSGEYHDLPELAIQYCDYSKWHNEWRESPDALKNIVNWRPELPDSNTLLNLPLDFDRPVMPSLKGKRSYFEIEESLSSRIYKFSADQATTPFLVLLSSYAILLNKLSQQDLIVIGVPLSNRRNEEFKDTFGCFVNILPVAIDFSQDPTSFEIRTQIRQKLLFAHRNQEVSFLDILSSTHGKRILSYNPLYQTGFTFEPPMDLELNDLHIKNIPVEKEGSQLDLFLTMWEDQTQFSGYIEYASDLFSPLTIERIKESYIETVNQIIETDKKVNSISLLSLSDRKKLQKWNSTEMDVNTEICLHQKFEEQVVLFPDNIAISDTHIELTYAKFNIHVNRLAHFLIDSGVKIEDIVGVCLNRSIELMIAIYAIHKAGGAYLPIDPNYPSERLEIIIDDASPKFILTTKLNSKNLGRKSNFVCIDNILETPLSNKNSNPNLKISSNNLAYLMYTSGSTGKPKGVMIEHKSVINKLEWMQFQHPIDKTDTMLLKTPITFDVSVWELFWWYFNGAKLALLPVEGEKDPKTIADHVEKQKVTVIIFVPSMFSPFVEYIKTKQVVSKLSKLKYIIQIGEALSPQLVMNFNELRNIDFSPLLVNTYGPTEATVAVSYFSCPERNPVNKVYIGKPIFNTKLLIINKYNIIQPIGIPGELVVAGTNLSRGYLNRPELNREKFIKIKDLNENDIRVYKTGDLVRWVDEGELEFIGRLDNQIKIRGYRIELGDVEAKILEHIAVKTTAVIVNKSNFTDSHMIGYIVLKDNATCSIEEIRKFISSKLPDYMIPSYLMIIDKMPLNTSGKIDRKSLPDPEFIFEKDYVEPKTKFEKALVRIWSGILDQDVVGINNNFFDIGGNSLSAIRMVNEIKMSLMIDIEPLVLMQYPNIRALAEYLADLGEEDGEKSKIEIRTKRRDFSKIRNRLKGDSNNQNAN